MKLIIAGSTGLVGAKVVQQCLAFPEITSVIALSRSPIKLGPASTKVKNVVVPDYDNYSEQVKAELKGADACIWTVGITPLKSQTMELAQVKRVCVDCTAAGFNAMREAGTSTPFRFIYFSGQGVPEDGSQPENRLMGKFLNVRGEANRVVRAFAAQNDGVEICIARPGIITDNATWFRSAVHYSLEAVKYITRTALTMTSAEAASAVLEVAVKGPKNEFTEHAEMVTLGRQVLQSQK